MDMIQLPKEGKISHSTAHARYFYRCKNGIKLTVFLSGIGQGKDNQIKEGTRFTCNLHEASKDMIQQMLQSENLEYEDEMLRDQYWFTITATQDNIDKLFMALDEHFND